MDRFLDTDTIKHEVFAAGLPITLPPWPKSEEHEYDAEVGVPVIFDSEKDTRDVYWYNVKKDEGSTNVVSAGAYGLICLLTHSASSITTAFAKPYQIADKLRLHEKQYRLDLAKQFNESYERYEALVSPAIKTGGR
jgi:phosphoribosylamine-glycine ligase